MSIYKASVERPILTSVIYMIITTIGIVSFSRLSIDLMPEVTYPSLSVMTSYGNVGPQEMEELVTRPLEESLAAVQGVEEITSSSTEGRSSVRVSFTWGYDLDVAANDVRDRLDRVLGRLPEDIDRPTIRKFDPSSYPILILGISSDMNPLDARRLVEDQVKYRLERVPGVAAVDIRGGLYREIHVELRAPRIKALGIAPDQVISVLRNENRNIPAGIYDKDNYEILVRTQGEFTSIDEISNLVVTMKGNTPIKIGDIADVTDSWQEVRQYNRVNGKPGMRISINKQSGANTVEVAEAAKLEIDRLNRDIPQIQIIPQVDTSTYIRASISNVRDSALAGGILAVLILFVFLRNVSSTFIIATAIPISVLATFILMYFAGFTLNLTTFGGLALGIGMLLDCAIVVLENIYRHRESGLDPKESSIIGTTEVWSAIVASTTTTVVVFIPVIFIRGMSGILFQQMAYVVSFSLICSLIVALTLIPMLSSRFLHYRKMEEYKDRKILYKIYSASERAFIGIEESYTSLLNWSLLHRKTVLTTVASLFIVSIVLVRFIGVELMPVADENEVQINLEMAVGTRLDVVDNTTLAVEEIVRKEVPEQVSILTSVGGGGMGGGASGSYTSSVRVMLKPRNERSRSDEQIANDLRKILTTLPGVTIRTSRGQGLFMLRMTSSQSNGITLDVRGYDLEVGQDLARKVNEVVRDIPGITDTRVSREQGAPEQVIRLDRSKAADLGLSVSRIGDALQTAVGGSQGSYFREAGKQYRILVRLKEEERESLDDLLDLTILNNRNEPVVLRNVVNIVPQVGPAIIQRKDQERIITVTGNFTGRDMGSVINDVMRGLHSIPVPRDFSIIPTGDYEEQQKAFRELMLGLILSIFLVYMVMAGQFESFKDPLIILFAIPMALIGVVITMILTKTIFSMQAFIGCIMLGGIVVNNAILLVDYTNRLRREHGMELFDAIKLSGKRRLRPILMTSLATCLGLLPLSLGIGEGGEAQAPLARVVIGGILSSTLITLVLCPVIYSLFEERSELKSNNALAEESK